MPKEWNKNQIEQFKTADDMHVSPFYSDGKTYGTPTWIWSVVVDDQLFVRAYNGQDSSWYQSAMQQGAGKIHLAGKDYKVTFSDASKNKNLNMRIDSEYESKYHDSPYMPPMLKDGPVSATVMINPK